MPSEASTGRRARLRAQVTSDILDSARAHLAAEGPEGLSLRAIARDLNMGVSSLYRYFPSRDELLTELLVEAFDAQADAVAEASAGCDDPVDGLRAGMRAYRDWSLQHPPEFALAYGTPIPGFQAPAERTVLAGVRVGGILIDLLSRAWSQGRIEPLRVAERESALSVKEREGLDTLIARRGYSIPAGLMSLTVDLFIRVHGFVVMEAFGQLRPMAADPTVTFERTIVECCIAAGLSV
ncbi:MAG: TetR/AcrR family transcriptional regulator [Actinomycetes bacterium]